MASARASAPSSPQVSQTVTAETAAIENISPQAIRLLDKYVKYTAKGYVISAPRNVLERVSKKDMASIRADQSRLASFISSGKMVYSGGAYVPTSAGVGTLQAAHAKVKKHWYGIEVGLDAWLTSKITNGALGVSAIAAYIGGPYGMAIATALAVGAAVLNVCSKKSGWVYVYFIGPPPYTGAVCSPF